MQFFHVASAAALVFASACGGSAELPDAASGIDAAVLADASTDGPDADNRVCAVEGDCPCFSNYDCPATTTCTTDGLDNPSCLPGTRGTGVLGDACKSESDCETSLCVDGEDGGLYCSDRCVEAAPECPPMLSRCLFIGFDINEAICSPAPV